MKHNTKKILIGGSLLLATLFPTIIAAEKIQNYNDEYVVNNKAINNTTIPKEQIEIHIKDDGGGHGKTTFHFTSDIIHQYYSSYDRDYETNLYANWGHFNKLIDVEMDITFEIDKSKGIYAPVIRNYTDANTELTNSVTSKFIFAPTQVVSKGEDAVVKYASIPYLNGFDERESSSEKYFFDQNYDGETGVSFVLEGLRQSTSIKNIEPIIFHLTWDESLNNGSKLSDSSIYYNKLKSDYINLNFKTKSIIADKAYGISEGFDFDVDSYTILSSFNGKDILDEDKQVKYFSSLDNNQFYVDFLLNSISNSINFQTIDLSDKSIQLQLDRIAGDGDYYTSFEISFPTFHTILPLDELITSEEMELFETYWNSTDVSNATAKVNIDEMDSVNVRNESYNNTFFVGNKYFNITNVIDDLYIANDELYVSEKILIKFGRDVSPSNFSYYSDATFEMAKFLRGGVLEQMASSTIISLDSDDVKYEYNSGLGYEGRVDGLSTMVYKLEDSANFMTNPQWILITFSILSIVGLVIVILFLVKSSNKEEKGIEIAGGDK